jgi:hypothetical protein
MHPEAFQVVEGIVERVDLQLATIAGPGVHLANGQGTFETPVDGPFYLGAQSFKFGISEGLGGLGNDAYVVNLMEFAQHVF